MTSITLCMIVKDEAHCLERCLRSVQGLCSELIVVDTGSRDDTVAIAQRCAAKVIASPWQNDFSLARNVSLDHAQGEWILVLDADEELNPDDHQQIRLLTQREQTAYLLTQRHYTNDIRLAAFTPASGALPQYERGYAGYFESSLVRLFPRHPAIRFRGAVHELVEHAIGELPGFSIVDSKIRIHHYGNTPEMRAIKEKGKLYTTLGEHKVQQDPTNWKMLYELGVEHNNNGRRAESAEALRKSLAANPQHYDTWVNLGYVLCELGNYEEAGKVLQTAVQRFPRPAEAWCNLGVVFLRTSKFPQAVESFLRSLEITPTYVNAMSNASKAFAHLKRMSEAALMLYRVLELVPNHSIAHLELAALLASHDRSAARAHLDRARQGDPHNPFLLELDRVLTEQEVAR